MNQHVKCLEQSRTCKSPVNIASCEIWQKNEKGEITPGWPKDCAGWEKGWGSPETLVLALSPTLFPLQMSNKRSNSFRQAILQGNRRLCSKALLEEKGLNLSQRLIRHVAYETLPREIDRKWYYDSYTCCPPPWFMITVTLLEARMRVGKGLLSLGRAGARRLAEITRGRAVSSAPKAVVEEPAAAGVAVL